ncbi:flippase [Halorhabdus sp. CUG00001]|uniref:flippase n=1 Tax=Halorhabdus sp. CUG00001 TaxID=2600297 RepID=UPI00131E43EA|nr:flippase [Halorhabdus sp. CUG00001]
MTETRDLEDSLSSILSSAGTLLFSSVSSRVLSFLAYIALVRVLPARQFGLLMLAHVIVDTTARVIVVGIPDGISRQAATEKSTEAVMKAGLLVVVPLATVVTVLIFFARHHLAALLGEPGLSFPLAILSLVAITRPLAMISIATLRGMENARDAALARDIIPQTVSLIVFLALAFFGYAYIGSIGYWFLLPVVMIGVATIPIYQRFGFRSLVGNLPQRSVVRGLVQFSWPLALQSVFVLLMTNFDVLAIGFFRAAESVGFYKSVVPVAQMTLVFLFSFIFLYLPIATQYYESGDLKGLGKIYKVSTKWVSLTTFPLVLFLVLFPDDVIRVLFSATYLPAEVPLAILAIGMFLRVAVGPNAATVKAIDQTRVDLVSAIVGLVVNVVLTVIFVPRLGLAGAAVATTIGFACYNIVEVVVIFRHIGGHPFSWNTIKPIFATTLFGVGLLWALPSGPFGLGALAVIGTSLATVELLTIVATRSLEPEDRIIINQIEEQTNRDLAFLKQFVPQS